MPIRKPPLLKPPSDAELREYMTALRKFWKEEAIGQVSEVMLQTSEEFAAQEHAFIRQLPLAAKMLVLQNKVGAMSKLGHYHEGNVEYDFIRADDLWLAIQNQLAVLGIFSTVEIPSSTTEEVRAASGRAGSRTVIDLVIHIENVDSPLEMVDERFGYAHKDRRSYRWRGAGIDFGDKDITKATTLAHKYWWLATLKVGDGGATDADAQNVNQPEQGEAVDLMPKPKAAPAATQATTENGTERWDKISSAKRAAILEFAAPLNDVPGAPHWFPSKVEAKVNAIGYQKTLAEIEYDHKAFCTIEKDGRCAHGVVIPSTDGAAPGQTTLLSEETAQ